SQCVLGQFQCQDRSCINDYQRCDRQRDCPNGEDEQNCPGTGPCSSNEWRCSNGICISKSSRCDSKRDCPDNSDETNCDVCKLDQFRCDNSSCISLSQRCDGKSDCSYGEDEKSCALCRNDEYKCTNGQCVYIGQRCDGRRDCQDGSDELNCDGDTFRRCHPSDFQCTGGYCIMGYKRCNGIVDCPSGNDEENCTSYLPVYPKSCRSDEVKCSDGSCTPGKKCDNVYDCEDGSDEYDCETTCRSNQFKCASGECIEGSSKCDSKPDCRDGSDESDCVSPKSCPLGEVKCSDDSCTPGKKCDNVYDCEDGSDEYDCETTCKSNQFKCASGECIEGSSKCDSKPDCRDGSDERDCVSPGTCGPEEVKCNDGSCTFGKKCDNIFDCIDGSDESGCSRICSPSQFKCASGDCIDEFLRCDSKIDCADGSDEKECVFECPGGKFRCTDGLCLDTKRRCDGYPDCNDGADEIGCANDTRCSPNDFECGDGACIPTDRVCDRRRDCPDGSDENNCQPKRCSASEFTCEDGNCIPLSQQCNGRNECSDGSDEEDCPCTQDQFLCLDGQCIDGSLRCDRRRDCSDGSDEQNCPTEPPTIPSEPPPTPRPRCPPGEFQCRSGNQCIFATQVCDGPADCFDFSDEADCGGTSTGLQLMTYPNAQDIKENIYKPDREVVFQCRDEGPLRAPVRWTRPNGQPLPPGSRDVRGRLEIPNIKVEHSGEYICEAIGFPPAARNAQVRVQLTVERWVPPPTRPPTACAASEATCSNGDCIPKQAVCDGRKDCTDGSDEIRCNANGCEPNEFRCANKKCVMKTWKCDGDDDCGDGSDESDCATNPPGSICLYHHFTCHTNNQCIPKSYHCDIERDCVDGSDEIGCSKPVVSKPPPPMVTLAIGELFEISCTAVGVPVPEIVWRRNWGHIPPKCRTTSVDGVGVLTCPDIQPEDQGAYSCESINTKGQTFAVPDTILMVTTENVCRPGYFNSQAKTEAECIKCFCFGQAVNCRSADLFIYHYQPPFDSLKALGVRVDPITGAVEIRDEPIYRNAVPQLTAVGLNGVNSYLPSRVELTQPNLVPYFAMPENYHGNQLKSYGGYLRYNINHGNRGYEVAGPDVILSGNSYILLHQSRQPPESFRGEDRAVRFFVGEWVKRSENAPETIATREDIMMALANIDNILLKLQYNEGQLNTTISNIIMESAAAPDNNLGAASYVEECSCPVGYTGISCERCDEGYERHNSGPWLGQCYKVSPTCPSGTYGDPGRGIECKVCPCPLTNPSNQFGRTCSLAPDGDVICDCPSGYTGRRCEQCSAGYEGNPMIPGDSCRLAQQDVCNSAGTRSAVGSSCNCKSNVEGPTCNQCKANAFYLSPDNQFGCISCFCMGVASQCGSSSWYRDQISSAFTSSTNDFSIVDIDNRENPITEGIRLDSGSRQILFSSFPTQNVFYWSLPSRYLGNQLTAYGGNLRYTLKHVPSPGGQSSRNSAADVQLISANHIDLLYYAKGQTLPTNSAQTFVVPLLEQHWQRSDGQVADREHLLMALADLKAIYIKATYTTNTMESALVSVSLDTANVRNTGSLERASSVEHCYCPEGYKGLSCEDCAFGYTRGDGGLYLGFCEPCNCNGHSNECHPETGECMNCRDHTAGRFCDQCLPGYEGDPQHGIPCRYREGGSCQCDSRGAISNECFNGMCRCKPNVEGNMCDRCRQGTFGLNSSNVEGCQSCFCSGVARECSESSYYIEQIPTQILDEDHHGFSLTDQNLQRRISNNFQFNYAINEISYRFGAGESRLYWSLPQLLTGNQIKSYGGKLEFRQRYTEYSRSRPTPDQDVIIVGDRHTIYWTNPNPLIPEVQNRVSVPISAASGWQRLDQTAGPRPASREDILVALSNIKEILVRAQPSDTTESSSISDVTLDTAIEPVTTGGRATNVEVCRCPLGYEGSSCESCTLGYYRDVNDISAGALGSCTKCPCTQNAHGCNIGPDNFVVCHCIPGYSGSRCEYVGDNNGTDNTDNRPNTPPPVTINVTIVAPNIKIFEIGSTLRLNCSAISYRTQSPAQIMWTKDGGSLPQSAIDDGRGILIITDLRVSDSGRYICEAQDGYSIVTKDITVIVGTLPPEPPRVVVNPPFVDVREGQRIEIQCAASGNPAPNYILQRIDNQPLNPAHYFYNGVFRIDQVVLSDAGKYDCIAQNSHGTDRVTFEVFVRVADFVRVSIEPSSVRSYSGQPFTLRCLAANALRDIKWSKDNGQLPYNSREENGVLTVSNANARDSGVYICTITTTNGASGRGTAQVEIIEPEGEYPTVSVSSDRLSISRGSSNQLRCDATGSPTPSIKWKKSNGDFSEHVEQIGSILYIRNADERDEGTYLCVASNRLGLAQAHVDVYISRGYAPTVRIYPDSTQRVLAGHTLDLECISEGGSPSRITWRRRDGLALGRNVEQFQRGNIRFNQITKTDEGEYVCTAENEAGMVTAVATIYVQAPPEIRIVPDQEVITRREGDSLTLECHASGSPAPTVFWRKYEQNPRGPQALGGEEERSTYSVKQFNRLTRYDEGLYICQARSDTGTVQKRVQLIVDTLPVRGDITGEDATSGNDNGYKDLERPQNPNDINHYTAPVGTQAELRCSISTTDNRYDQVDTKWVRTDNAPLPENAFIRGGTLFIDNVQDSAKGPYSCLGTRRSTGQLLFTLNAYLDVISPPNITLVPKRQVVHPGDNAYIQCSANGQQPITITWSPMSRAMPASVTITDGLLQFNNIKISDAGRYRCTAVNSAGEADAVADVFVQETRYRPSISAVNKTPIAPVGSSITLQCHIENATVEDIKWFRERERLPPNSYITPERNLQINNVQMSDEGRYYCEIPTSSGYSQDFVDLKITGPSPDANLVQPTLYISPPERDFHIGENVDINCQSNQPGAITTWSKPSEWLDDNVQNVGGTLRIQKLKQKNAGIYRCEATGYQGVYHKDYNLKIVEDASLFQAAVETKIAPKGSGVVLECRTDLQEPISYVWTKAGGELPRYIDPFSRTIQLNDVASSDAGAYMCSAENGYRKVEIPVILVITGIVPYFTQAPVSYIALPTLMDPYIQFSFEISIKPELEDGLILYNGNKQNERGSDFISLALVGGVPEFRYNLGHSVTIVRAKPISIGQWHTIKVVRNRKKATMYVDGEGSYVGNADGKYIGLDLSENLYLGGVPKIDKISPEVEMEIGFVGCISRFKVGHAVQDILRDALEKEGVTNCETCSENRCQNKGVCQESLTNEGYVCICHSGFSGATCSKLKGEACSPYSCGSGRCVDNDEGFECMCPMGKTGSRCEKEIRIQKPAFQNDAFIAYSVPKQRRLKYSMKIKPNSTKDGILLYCGETEEGHGDFASLALKNQHVEFRFDVGNGPTIIRSPRKINPGETVAITASRSLSEGRLIVSGDSPVVERSPGNNKTPNLLTYLYVGGVDKQKIKVNDGVEVSSGFDGCISDINVGGTEINMIQSAVDSSNVQDCSNIHHSNDMNNNIEHNPTSPTPYNHHQTGCSSSPCRNDGICYPLSPTSYQCSCINGYTGKDCELAPNQCEYLKPCQNNGTCRGNTTFYSCDCPLGYTGINCEQRAELKNDAHFDGNGYLEFDKEMLPHENENEEEVIALEMSTNSSNGLIFWHGQSPNQDAQGQDYLALSVVNGFLEFSYDLGSGPAIIHNGYIRVNDGERHLVILKRRGKSGSIEIDNQYTQKDESVGSATTLTCRGNIYLGGAPDITFMTANRYKSGFVGCVHGFELQGTKQIDLGRKALGGRNVKACSSYEGIYSYESNEENSPFKKLVRQSALVT
ncbi:hypothetical protein HHI36_006131, partial [Cryptolaemus montrouzieri]